MFCAFTGHRPQRLPWGNEETDPRCAALKIQIGEAVDHAIEQGCTAFLCGMARGCDTWFAEAVLARGQRLIAMLPCPGQADLWQTQDRQRYERLLQSCEICVLEPEYTEGCMFRRNCAMVDRAQLLISVYDGGAGGTGHTVSYAKRRGVRLLPIWL